MKAAGNSEIGVDGEAFAGSDSSADSVIVCWNRRTDMSFIEERVGDAGGVARAVVVLGVRLVTAWRLPLRERVPVVVTLELVLVSSDFCKREPAARRKLC